MNITDLGEFADYLPQDFEGQNFRHQSHEGSLYSISPSPDAQFKKHLKKWVFQRDDMFCDRFGYTYFHNGEAYGGEHDSLKHKSLGLETINSMYALGLLERNLATVKLVVEGTPNSFLKAYFRLNALSTLGLDFLKATHIDRFKSDQ